MFANVLDPAVRETDFLQLTLLTFLPTIFALLLFVIPARCRELMRWWALLGAAATLILGLCTFVDYHRLLESYSDRDVRTMYHPATRLEARSDQQLADATRAVPRAYNSFDLLARRPWIEHFGVNYALAVDGVSLALVLLTALITLLALVASWRVEDRLRGYLILLLTLETGVIGAFLATDMFLFYVFYEVMLFPMYFLIGLWGGGRRKYAAIKFVIYTLVGGVGLLVAIVALHSVDVRDFVPVPEGEARSEAVYTFDPVTLSKVGRAVMLVLGGHEEMIRERSESHDEVGNEPASDGVRLFAPGVNRVEALARLKAQSVCTREFQYILFALLFVGFAVKVPIVPLHSWLPDAHVEAPTPVSMVLAGVLLKLGGYGLFRFAIPLAPWAAAELSWYVGLLGAIGIVYGALVAMGQTDFKKLLAYSSVSHMGYVVLGLAAWSARPEYWEWAANGAIFQMLAHGVTSTALFFAVGVIYDRAHHRDLDRLGGLTEPMPVFTGLSAILLFALLGLPGLCGFVGEVMVMLGAWAFSPALTAAAIGTTVLTAAYLLRAWQKVYWGTNPATAHFPDVSPREFSVLATFAVLAIVMGVLPGFLIFQWVEPSVQAWVENLAVLRQ